MTRVGINGFGRMGRLALRAGWGRSNLEFVAVNDPGASEADFLHLLEFDSVQGRWPLASSVELSFTQHGDPADIDWAEYGVEVVLECSGLFRDRAIVQKHLNRGAQRVVVSAPVPGDTPDIVMGVNDDAFDLASEPVVTAASCTTNCIAPVVRVLHDAFQIEHGFFTTIHDPTATQVVVDGAHPDLRRARASMLNLVPTSTNSAVAVTRVIPELQGRLDAIAVRVPVMNSSLVELVITTEKPLSVEAVNTALRVASESPRLAGILGYEQRPLVSTDFVGDSRSGIVDAASTRVMGEHMAHVLVWYDNEWGYANRMIELTEMVGRASRA